MILFDGIFHYAQETFHYIFGIKAVFTGFLVNGLHDIRFRKGFVHGQPLKHIPGRGVKDNPAGPDLRHGEP